MSSVVTLYASVHGHARQVALRLPNYRSVDYFDGTESYDFYVFVCPTYGDEELPWAMEDFLMRLTVENKKFTVVELGNYYGYDDFQFGARRLICGVLKSKGWVEAFPSLSLDSLPQIDWEVFNHWKGLLDGHLISESLSPPVG